MKTWEAGSPWEIWTGLLWLWLCFWWEIVIFQHLWQRWWLIQQQEIESNVVCLQKVVNVNHSYGNISKRNQEEWETIPKGVSLTKHTHIYKCIFLHINTYPNKHTHPHVCGHTAGSTELCWVSASRIWAQTLFNTLWASHSPGPSGNVCTEISRVHRGQSTARGGARSLRVQPCPGAARAWHSPGGPTGGRAGHLEHPGFYSSPFLRDTRPLRAVWGLCCSPPSSSPPSFPSWHPRENKEPAPGRAGPRALL